MSRNRCFTSLLPFLSSYLSFCCFLAARSTSIVVALGSIPTRNASCRRLKANWLRVSRCVPAVFVGIVNRRDTGISNHTFSSKTMHSVPQSVPHSILFFCSLFSCAATLHVIMFFFCLFVCRIYVFTHLRIYAWPTPRPKSLRLTLLAYAQAKKLTPDPPCLRLA